MSNNKIRRRYIQRMIKEGLAVRLNLEFIAILHRYNERCNIDIEKTAKRGSLQAKITLRKEGYFLALQSKKRKWAKKAPAKKSKRALRYARYIASCDARKKPAKKAPAKKG